PFVGSRNVPVEIVEYTAPGESDTDGRGRRHLDVRAGKSAQSIVEYGAARNGPAQRTDAIERRGQREHAFLGYATRSRRKPDQPAESRRNPDRCSRVSAERNAGCVVRDGSCATGARAARHA